MVERAMLRRTTDVRQLNAHSSRSHAFLTLHVLRRNGSERTVTSAHLCDLAGSENYDDKTPHAGINVSLLALGQVHLCKGAHAEVVTVFDKFSKLDDQFRKYSLIYTINQDCT